MSAIQFGGKPKQFLDPAVDGHIDLAISEAILEETSRVLRDKGLLRRFRVTFDRRRQRLLLTPGALFNVPYDYDLTGLTIVQNGRTFAVGRIAPGTIASSAGFRAGDVILKIGGRATVGMNLRELRASLRHDGRERVLAIHRLGLSHALNLVVPLVKSPFCSHFAGRACG